MSRLAHAIVWVVVAIWLAVLCWLFGGFRVHAEAPTPVPATYALFDYGTDFRTLRPDAGPVGSVHQHAWEDINPAPGVYNWVPIDAALATEDGLMVELLDGRVVQKPVLLLIVSHYSSSSKGAWKDVEGVFFYDATPGWVYDGIPHENILGKSVGHILESGGKRAVLPSYDQLRWRSAWLAMVAALGERYDDDPRVSVVTVPTGLDTETHPIKAYAGVEWADVMRSQASAVEYRFGQFVPAVLHAYDAAFPNTALTFPQIPGSRMHWAELAAVYGGHIGLHPAGAQPDTEAYKGYGKFIGLWDPIGRYSDTLPIFPETSHDGDRSFRLWSTFMIAHNRPVAASIHKPVMEGLRDADLLWLAGQYGETSTAWTVFRDWEYQLQGSLNMGASGKVGDWGRHLQRTTAAPIVLRNDLPAAQSDPRSRQCRRVDGMLSVAVDQDWAVTATAYELRVTYLDTGTGSFVLSWAPGQSIEVVLGGLEAWVTLHVPILTHAAQLTIEGDGLHVHRIELEAQYEQSATATPTIRATATATHSPTQSPSCTATTRPTGRASETPTVNPRESKTPTEAPSYDVQAEIRVTPGAALYVNGASVPVVEGVALVKVGPAGTSVELVQYPPGGLFCGSIQSPSWLRYSQDGCRVCIDIPYIPFSIVWPSVAVQVTPTPRRYLVEIYWNDTIKWRPYHSLALPLIERTGK